MASDDDKNLGSERLRDLPLRSGEIGFSPDEMVSCPACGKANAPNRPACLYCGTTLGNRGITRLDIRVPDGWENGFNVVVIDTRGADLGRAAVHLASLLGMERAAMTSILSAGKELPLARVESENQAKGIAEKLNELGIRTMIVEDESLHPASPPTRLRAIVFDGGSLKLELFNGSEIRSLGRDDLVLIVPGIILEVRAESVEKRKLRGSKTLQETETSSDGFVIDIYSRNDPIGRRIPSSGFDFSCLGSEKSLTVAENMKKLTARLAEFSPSAKVVDDYARVRSLLEHAWPSDSKRESQHLGVGRKVISKVLASNNLAQLTKYSRLQWRLYEEKV